ncbi:MAG: Rab family GTPase [Candidatus Hodarchaeales archaeon]|jgi:small GTP-binding protein
MLAMKVLILGDGAVGKTSLRHRYMGRGFKATYLMTVGADFVVKELAFQDGTTVALQIWDIAGQGMFENLRSTFYQGAVGALMVYDVTRPDTLENVTKWIAEISKYHQLEYFPIVLIGNKIDLRESIAGCLSTSQGEKLTRTLERELYNKNWKIPFIETSAKTGEKVEDAFVNLSKASIEFYKRSKTSLKEK